MSYIYNRAALQKSEFLRRALLPIRAATFHSKSDLEQIFDERRPIDSGSVS